MTAIQAVCPRSGSMRQSGNVYPHWHVRFGCEYHGVELRSLWRDTLLSVQYPLDLITARPAWAVMIEVGYQDKDGAWHVVPHTSPDTIESDSGAIVHVSSLRPVDATFTL